MLKTLLLIGITSTILVGCIVAPHDEQPNTGHNPPKHQERNQHENKYEKKYDNRGHDRVDRDHRR